MFALGLRRANVLARGANAKMGAIGPGRTPTNYLPSCRNLAHSVQDAGTDNGMTEKKRRLDIAIVGAPNAGKSQLLNSLIGSKVAAVSRKRHTTRTGILGALTVDDSQLVFIDTPGFLHHSKGSKEGVRKLLGAASMEMEVADYVLLVIDAARNIDDDLRRTLVTLMFMALRAKGRREVLLEDDKEGSGSGTQIQRNERIGKFSVIFNKVDLVSPKEKLLHLTEDVGSLAECCLRHMLQQMRNPTKTGMSDIVNSVLKEYKDQSGFEGVDEDDIEMFIDQAPEFFYTSAKTKDDEGVDDVLALLLERATPSRQWIVSSESSTGMTPVEQAEEIIREKLYRCLHREVPHSITQQNQIFKGFRREGDDTKMLRIDQVLVVRTESHRRLVVGKGAMTLERIRTTAIKDLEEAFGCEVELNLHVKKTKSFHDVTLEQERSGVVSF